MIKHVRQRMSAQLDGGIALVVAISLIGLVSVLMLTMVAYALRETGASGRDRQRSSAVSAAEGQVDLTVAKIQQAVPATLPCGAQPGVNTKQSVADSISVITTITYYNAAEAVVACSSVPTSTVVSAKVSATATSAALAGQTPARRTIESLIRLTAEYDNGLNKAIFGNRGVQVSGSGTVYSQPGPPNADVYTSGDFSCSNNSSYNGSVYARGRIQFSNTCDVAVDLHAGTGLVTEKTTVGGQALVTNGSATLKNTATVARPVRASGTITWGGCSKPGACFPGSPVAPVPVLSFPVINWIGAEAAWAAAGYTNVVVKPNCNGADTALQWIVNNAASTTRGKTVLVTNCKISFSNGVDVRLADDLAVFATAGFEFNNSVDVRSNNSLLRRLYLMQPYDAGAPHPCTSTGILAKNRFDVYTPVEVLLYSPCTIELSNNFDLFGQIYAGGDVKLSNSLDLFYRPLPIYGVPTPPGSTARSYALDTVYKRENR